MPWIPLLTCLAVVLAFHVGYDVVLLKKKHRVGGIFWLVVIGFALVMYTIAGGWALAALGPKAPFWWSIAGGGLVGVVDSTIGAFIKRFITLKAFKEVGTPWNLSTPVGWLSLGMVGAVMGAAGGAVVRFLL